MHASSSTPKPLCASSYSLGTRARAPGRRLWLRCGCWFHLRPAESARTRAVTRRISGAHPAAAAGRVAAAAPGQPCDRLQPAAGAAASPAARGSSHHFQTCTTVSLRRRTPLSSTSCACEGIGSGSRGARAGRRSAGAAQRRGDTRRNRAWQAGAVSGLCDLALLYCGASGQVERGQPCSDAVRHGRTQCIEATPASTGQ
jgi:hypothetical protein